MELEAGRVRGVIIKKIMSDICREEKRPTMSASYAAGFVLAALSGLLFWLGLCPDPLISLVRTLERSLTG